MKRLYYLLFVFSYYNSFAQLFVSNNTFIYNKNSVVFVTGNVELSGANSNFYLRNQGQLLQGTTGASTNKGVGKLSVFQEGTVNNFAYNYWCSPVGNASATPGNEDFGITMLNVPTSITESTPVTVITDDSDGQSGTGSLAISNYWIWKYLSSSTYAQWLYAGSATTISAGQGFTMKGTEGTDATNVGETAVNNPGSAQRYDFRGKPNDGNISVNVGAGNFTLTGNPYPSAFHVNAFLLDAANAACDGIAYYWEQDKTVNSHMLLAYQGGYGTYAPVSLLSNGIYVPATFNTYNIDGTLNATGVSSGLTIERKYAPVGQGFMVKGSSNGTLTLKNAYRTYKLEGNYSQFEKNASSSSYDVNQSTNGVEAIPQIRLNTVMNSQYTNQIALAFVSQATDGVDRGIDAKSPVEENVPNDVYFVLDNDRYVIQGVKFDVDKRIKLGVKATNMTTFKFNASMVLNFDESQPIYIYDAQDGLYHDVKNASYEVMLPTGVYNNRFELTFKNAALSLNENSTSNLTLFQNNGAQLLTVSNPGLLEIKSIKLYDLNGKLLLDKEQLGVHSDYKFSTIGLADAVYLTEVTTTDNQKTVQKIIICAH
ncbi:T9SS type A sorting domain-containing protein [Flavobacterium sp. XGLA_31]|uniref:T9SS type A sorting domain-containing protein n=1 Tax=Flavobacterium sp. XGLA_31 TaxID=3447666 RepID=UPI003F34BD10